jgi:uncharacterized repeat protein (TIGR03843 family)
LIDASNVTLVGAIRTGTLAAECVYKPVAGERPLWDFPDGTLAGREVAAFAVSEAGGWGVVPPTVLRDGPFGPGMVQLWVDTVDDPDLVDVMAPEQLPSGWLRVLDALGSDGEPVVLGHADDPRLRQMAVLDVVLNNADRKGGHVLEMTDGHRYGVDHGVTFHTDHKLRTVLWGWLDEPLTEAEVAAVSALRAAVGAELGAALAGHLTDLEIDGIARRIDRLLARGSMPAPRGQWPAVPWPPF